MEQSLRGEHEELLRLIVDADRDAANALIDRWAGEHGYTNALSDVLEPVLREIGDRWGRDEISLAQGVVAGKIAEDTLTKALASADGSERPPARGPVVIGNIEDDFHSLGRKMVVTFLRTAGWQVIDLGNDVPPHEFVARAVESDARIIGVSAMMLVTARTIRQVRDELDRLELSGRVQLAVGGAVFKLRPELMAEVGGDGTADSALAAPTLFDELWRRSHGRSDAA